MQHTENQLWIDVWDEVAQNMSGGEDEIDRKIFDAIDSDIDWEEAKIQGVNANTMATEIIRIHSFWKPICDWSIK